jgi:mitotic spindle assembly checkpoint protein MAD2
MASAAPEKDKSKVHKLSLKGSAKLVAEFFQYSIHTILYDRRSQRYQILHPDRDPGR